MDKIDMRDWIVSLETVADNKLVKWRKIPKVENGEAVQLAWQWDQTRIALNVFWEDGKELVNMQYTSPRISHTYSWHGLGDRTFNKVMDRLGNLAQITMHPPIDPMDFDDG